MDFLKELLERCVGKSAPVQKKLRKGKCFKFYG